MKIISLLFAIVLCGLRAQAKPACNNMKLFSVPTNYSMNSTQTLTFNARVQADTSGGGCNYFITVDYGSSSSYNTRSVKYGGNSWPYQIAKDAAGTQILKAFPDAISCSNALCDSLSTGSNHVTKDNDYQFILDSSNQWRKYGSYSDNYTLRLYRGTPSSYTLMDQATMNVTFMAPKKADIAIVDSGAGFDLADTTQVMNFGAMSTGAQKSADLIVKYNAGCTLYASSQNNGNMKHTSLNQLITYTMTINGYSINLSNSSNNAKAILYGSGVSPANGDVNPVVVTVGNTGGKSPGVYSDTITFTVQSNE
jgi:hypothetical protein